MHTFGKILFASSVLVFAQASPASAVSPADQRMGGSLRHILERVRMGASLAALGGKDVGTHLSATSLTALSRSLMIEPTAADPLQGPVARYKAIVNSADSSAVAELEAAGARIRGRMGTVISFDGPILMAERFASIDSMVRLDIAQRLKPELNISKGETGATAVRDPAGPFGVAGEGTLVAVIDAGQDLRHKDFRKPNRKKRTRFRAAYNMGSNCRGNPPPGHSTGCYYTETRINKFLKGRAKVSYSDPSALFGHGSHVMGIAAGNGRAARSGTKNGRFVGMAPKAGLIGVKVFNNLGDFVGDIVEALQFLDEEQARQGNIPLAVNISLGGHFGAHDGSDPDEIAIDAFIIDGINNNKPRVVVKSAGNSGPLGVYVGGTQTDPNGDIRTFTIPGGSACSPLPGTGNDSFLADIWYEGNVDLQIDITSPAGGATSTFSNSTGNPGPIEQSFAAGTIFIDCQDTVNPVNGLRECIFGVDDTGGTGPQAGTWDVVITATNIPSGATGQYDAWIVLAEKGRCTWDWDFPDFGKTISIPGTSFNGITVGATVTRTQWVNIDGVGFAYNIVPPIGDIADFSSVGPTRDGRTKPELVAPGMGIASSRARTVNISPNTEGRFRTLNDGQHMIQEGTSMAAPHVTGAAALLFSLNPGLNANDILSLLTGNTNTTIPGSPSLPSLLWGYGKLDVAAAAAATP